MLFTKKTAVLKHLLRALLRSQHKQQKCYSMVDFLLSANSNAHKLLFRTQGHRTAINNPRIPKLEAHCHLRSLQHSETPTTRFSSHRPRSSLGQPKALNQPPEENVKHTNQFHSLGFKYRAFLALLLFCFYFF